MSQWDENMEYLEAYDDAHLDEIEDEAEENNRQLDIIDQDRIARENGDAGISKTYYTPIRNYGTGVPVSFKHCSSTMWKPLIVWNITGV